MKLCRLSEVCGVGVDHEHRQAGLEGAFTQLLDRLVDGVAAGQQDGADFHAVHRRQAGGDQHVRTVCGGYQQRARAEVFQHVRDAARAEGHGLHAASHYVAFIDHAGLQVASHVDGAGGDQIEAPRHAAQNRQRAVGEQLRRIDVGDAGFGGVVEDFGQVRTGAALIVDRCVQLVDDHAGDVLFLLPPKLVRASSMRSFSCAGESLPSASTKTISAFRVLAIS